MNEPAPDVTSLEHLDWTTTCEWATPQCGNPGEFAIRFECGYCKDPGVYVVCPGHREPAILTVTDWTWTHLCGQVVRLHVLSIRPL